MGVERKICATCRWCTERNTDGYPIFICVAEQMQVELDDECRFWDGYDVEEDYYGDNSSGS